MTIEQLYEIYLQHPNVETDTRKIKPDALFFALKGPNFNGNQFAANALELGARYAIIDESQYFVDHRTILVKDVLETLQQLARHHRKQFNIPFIAITGSNGKTTSKELVTTVLRTQFKTYATIGNLNNHIGVPLTILSIQKDAQMAVIEMGANHQKEIEAYCSIALPNYGVINNCGKAHIEGFGGIDGVRKGKGELFDHIRENKGLIFINTDLDYLLDMAVGITQKISYGTSEQADYKGEIIDSSQFLKVKVAFYENELIISTKLVGAYNLPNVLLACAIGGYFGISPTNIQAAIEAYEPDNSRSQLLVKGTNNIILDAYNANPTSMRAAIENFAKMEGKKIIMLGGMKEMGQDELKEHQELIEFINQWAWDPVILVGKEFEPVKGRHLWFQSSEDAASYIGQNKPLDAKILIKGSRGSKMEVILNALD